MNNGAATVYAFCLTNVVRCKTNACQSDLELLTVSSSRFGAGRKKLTPALLDSRSSTAVVTKSAYCCGGCSTLYGPGNDGAAGFSAWSAGALTAAVRFE